MLWLDWPWGLVCVGGVAFIPRPPILPCFNPSSPLFSVFSRQGKAWKESCTVPRSLAEPLPFRSHDASIIHIQWNKAVCLVYHSKMRGKKNFKWNGSEQVTTSMLLQLKRRFQRRNEKLQLCLYKSTSVSSESTWVVSTNMSTVISDQ